MTIKAAGVISAAALCLAVFAATAAGQEPGWRANPEVVQRESAKQTTFNYDETRVTPYVLPGLFSAGAPITTPPAWQPRRAEILELFREQVYGRSPGKPEGLRFETIEENPKAMNGAATLRRIAIISTQSGREHRFELTLMLPNARQGATPVFLLLNNRPASNTDPSRRETSGFWPAEEVIARGYAMAALQNSDLAPDDKDRFRDGVIRLFEGESTARPKNAWGAIAAWAWGARRAMDYFETDARIAANRVVVVGHSRGGKAALWAGAEDERFAMVISNESGEGGAALSRRHYGETVTRINTSFPHWFADNYKTFNDRPADLPIDQHMLLALVAPRALYVASADEDLWSDPRGEFLSLAHTSPVYALWGDAAIAPEAMPSLSQPLVAGRRGYHVRPGPHNLTPWDWARFADFADRLWGGSAHVDMTWMSIANLFFQTGSLGIVADGYISRVPQQTFHGGGGGLAFTRAPHVPDVAAVTRVADAIGGADAVDLLLTGHSHFDHSFDTATWSKITGARAMGPKTTCFQMMAEKLSADRCTAVNGRETFSLANGVTMRVVRWNHSGDPAVNGEQHDPVELTSVPVPDPATGGLRAGVAEDFRNGGGGRAFLFTVDGPDGRLSWFVQDSASHVDLHVPIVVEGVNYGAPIENLKIAIADAGIESVDLWIGTGGAAIANLVLPVLKPKAYLPVHWDGLWHPFSAGMPAPFRDPALEKVLASARVELVRPGQYMDKWRLDRGGVRPMPNADVKRALGFSDTQSFAR